MVKLNSFDLVKKFPLVRKDNNLVNYLDFVNKHVLINKRGKDGVLYRYVAKCISVKSILGGISWKLVIRTRGFADIDWVEEIINTGSNSIISISLHNSLTNELLLQSIENSDSD